MSPTKEEQMAAYAVQIANLEKTQDGFKKDIKDLYKLFNEVLAKRLPVWATFLVSAMAATIGWLLSGGA